MYFHTWLGTTPFAQKRRLYMLIKSSQITLGGHYKAKIYGTLNCSMGRHMKVEHRVFFTDEEEALSTGFRPCGHCLRKQYKVWKAGL
jgi:hypothetical protein